MTGLVTGEKDRAALPGDLCVCGRQAVRVYTTDRWGDTGYCGIADGGTTIIPCLFCGEDTDHLGGRCPQYRLRLDAPPG